MALSFDYSRKVSCSDFVIDMVPVFGRDASPLGRLFSSGLDGLVTEWNLRTLQPRAVVESMGGSVWQLAAEHMDAVVTERLNGSSSNGIRESEENDSEDEGSSSSSDSDDEPERRAQRVALACEDGVVRTFEVSTAKYGLIYQKSFPRVKGRTLSVAWTWDGRRLVAGGSDGWCSSTKSLVVVRMKDPVNRQIRQLLHLLRTVRALPPTLHDDLLQLLIHHLPRNLPGVQLRKHLLRLLLGRRPTSSIVLLLVLTPQYHHR